MQTVIALVAALVLLEEPTIEPPIIEKKVVYYDISGTTERELVRAVGKLSPRKPFAALTDWRVTWVYHGVPVEGGQCRVAVAQSKLEATITLPRWADSSTAPDGLRVTWGIQIKDLEAHEEQHFRNGLEAAEAIQKALLALPVASSCDELKVAVDRTAQSIIGEALRKDRSYDVRTAHSLATPFLGR